MTVFTAIAAFGALIGLLLVIWAVMVYNGFVALRGGVSKSWSNIDVLLKQRHDELPKLVEVCRQYSQFEARTLQQVTDARARMGAAMASSDVSAIGQAESALRGALGGLMAVAEAYPELRADQTFTKLQTRVSELEAAIADRRELYPIVPQCSCQPQRSEAWREVKRHYKFTCPDAFAPECTV